MGYVMKKKDEFVVFSFSFGSSIFSFILIKRIKPLQIFFFDEIKPRTKYNK